MAVAVPGIADAAVVYVAERLLAGDEHVSSDGHKFVLRRVGGVFGDLEAEVTAAVLPVGEVIVFERGTPGATVMTTGRPVLYKELDSQTARRVQGRSGDPRGAGDYGQKVINQYKSFVAMPLAARGTVIGCMFLCRGASVPPFSRGDVDLAATLADRAALAIDNARLYDNARRTAVALQRALLPSVPDNPPGLDIASSYFPAGTHVIGGDWHDLVALSGRRAALIVGDAMGHGPEAAAAMVQLRTAAHALAAVEIPPAGILRELDLMTESIEAAPFATCLAMLIDTISGSCVAARAGHLPPMIAIPGGDATSVRMPTGLPLGVGAASFTEASFRLPAGATVAAYTDGLVENRARPVDEGMAALCDELARTLPYADSSLETACAAITQSLGAHGEDDITLVLARIRP